VDGRDAADLDELGISLAETEGLIDHLRAVESAECALVLKEQPDGSWKASMRSKGGVNVGILAEHMGGGGHAYASGFNAHEDLETVVSAVVMLLEDDEVAVPAGGAA
jgi:bifunctional oligoribonuclease and PAP phosphatase NrnA